MHEEYWETRSDRTTKIELFQLWVNLPARQKGDPAATRYVGEAWGAPYEERLQVRHAAASASPHAPRLTRLASRASPHAPRLTSLASRASPLSRRRRLAATCNLQPARLRAPPRPSAPRWVAAPLTSVCAVPCWAARRWWQGDACALRARRGPAHTRAAGGPRAGLRASCLGGWRDNLPKQLAALPAFVHCSISLPTTPSLYPCISQGGSGTLGNRPPVSVVHATLEPGAAWTHAVPHVHIRLPPGCVREQPGSLAPGQVAVGA